MQSDVNFSLVLCKPASLIIQPKFNQCKRLVLHPHFPFIYLTISILGSSIIFWLSLIYTLRFVPSTSKDKNVGVSVNAGTITDVLGVGGVIGNIANGINVGGNKGSSTGVTVFSQRIIALAPHSSYIFEKMNIYRSEDQYTKTEKYTVGSSVSFHEPQNINDCPWNLVLSYSTDEDFKTKNVMNVGIYISESITFPRAGWNSFSINTDKYINYAGLEPVHYIYRTE